MRILHVVPSYYPAVRYGGPIRSVHGLAKGLAARGHEVHVFTTNVDGPNTSDVPVGRPVDLDGVNVWYFETGLGRRLFRAPLMPAALDREMPRFDIVHTHSVFLWPTTVAARAARRHGVPYVLAPRGMLVRDLIARKSSLAKRAWIAAFEASNVAQAAAIHVTSEIEAADLAQMGLATREVLVVPNAVDVPEPQCDASLAACAAASRPYVVFLGRINWKKGLDRLIPAMSLVEGFDLVIAGNDEEDYRPTLEALIMQHGVAGRVRFSGPVDDEAKWRLLEGAAALALPSYSENFGIVVLEAMAVGTPVVVTPEVGLAPVVQASGAGLVASGDVEAVAQAISTLAGDRVRAREMGQAGRRLVMDRYSWTAIAAQMEAVYASLLPASSRIGRQATA